MALSMIVFMYLVVGLLSAAGSIAISRNRFSPKTEQIFFGLLLAPIASIYLAFADHFGSDGAWRIETIAVVLFVVLALVGIRLSVILMLGYALHGAWDLLHEIAVHSGAGVDGTSTLTEIPLAYGVFCAAYDWCLTGYFYTRRGAWNSAWNGSAP